MLTTIPFLFLIRQGPFEGYMLVYSDTYDNAVAKYTAQYPDAEIRNCTML